MFKRICKTFKCRCRPNAKNIFPHNATVMRMPKSIPHGNMRNNAEQKKMHCSYNDQVIKI